ncbi:hypothetical protein FZC33_11390 [Labrys sp. KNU-23]|uniref:hypothetical protein n=1 Tax=Labrys sp. KNU-23 TaxID=2789216 RepID=UPI0011ED6A1B|nr:hypothetical protein [Labrys sp. KNU-23]QEN86894.1 hypothetical protein FZC33_11390 [Labrys sp. KNU-23]
MTVSRSLRSDVRNPVLALPSAEYLQSLPPEQRALVARLLRELSIDARARADKSWRQNKGPMAVYWKAVGAYSTHLYRAIRPSRLATLTQSKPPEASE